MLRSSMRTIQNLGLVGLLFVLANPLTGCVPSFKGFRPVNKKEFSAKTKGNAEILFLEDFRKVRYGQVGESSLTTFWRVYKRVRINNRRGFAAATQVLRGGTLIKLNVHTRCPDGTDAQMGINDIQQITEQTTQMSLMKMKSRIYKLTAKQVSVGCVIDFYWEMNLKGNRFPQWKILRKYPLHQASFTFQYKEGSTYRAYLANMTRAWQRLPSWRDKKKATKAKLSDAEREQRVRLVHDQAKHEITLRLTRIPQDYSRRRLFKMLKSQLLPQSYAQTPRCKLDLVRTYGMRGTSYLVDWKDIDASFTKRSSILSESRTHQQKNYQIDEQQELNTDLAGIAAKVTAKVAGRDGKIWALYSHLQQHMTSQGRGTSSRNRLDRVYALHLGNDYEINMLYIVMLRSLGIRAYLALIAPNNYTYQNQPPNDPFSKVATYIASKSEGKWAGLEQENTKARDYLSHQKSNYKGGRLVKSGVVVDPSSKTLPFGYMLPSVAGTTAFIVDAGGGRFFKIAETSQNTKSFDFKATIQSDGTVTGVITRSCTGIPAAIHRANFMKQSLASWTKRNLGQKIKRYCGQLTTSTLDKAPKLSLNKLTTPFSFSYKFVAPSCFSNSQNSILFTLLPTSVYSLRGRKRLVPINFKYAQTITVHAEYIYPKGYTLDQDLGTKTLTAPSLQAVVKTQRRANGLKVYYQLQIKKAVLPAKSFKAVKTFLKQLKKLLSRKILIRKQS